jgi:prepilin-type processing-associated H-X9-DG protein
MRESSTPQPLNYETQSKRHSPLAAVCMVLIALSVASALAVKIFAASRSSFRQIGCQIPSRVQCQSNLRQVGQAILLYTNDFNGVYPDSLQTILLTEDITPEVFVCLNTNDTKATGPTTQAIAADMGNPGHVSYVYLGKGLTTATVQPSTIVVYEPLSNHGDGMNVLFGDGHVEFFDVSASQPILSRISSGRWPVTMPTVREKKDG